MIHNNMMFFMLNNDFSVLGIPPLCKILLFYEIMLNIYLCLEYQVLCSPRERQLLPKLNLNCLIVIHVKCLPDFVHVCMGPTANIHVMWACGLLFHLRVSGCHCRVNPLLIIEKMCGFETCWDWWMYF